MDLKNSQSCISESYELFSSVPEVAREQPCIMGIDEAGRGPVLGPMVYGTCYCPVLYGEELKDLKFADSKTLTEAQRLSFFQTIDNNEHMGWGLEVISPSLISNSMFKRAKYNLNMLSHDTAKKLIEKVLARGVKLEKVFLDTVGPPEKYQAKLSAFFPNLEITVSKKADSLFPIVSAASICAKVARDQALKEWVLEEAESEANDEGWGSGYPGDPATKKFLKEHIDPVFGFPDLVRFSWSTAKELMEKHCVKVLWDDEDLEEASPRKRQRSIASFFGGHDVQESRQRSMFFKERCLRPLSSWEAK
ncbi:unnamed protein product [Darwinula stevensoni]|uniref:Ribonuclease n=1 Tax=Darwinula stevensoni TaxID=69355 RepID=A0A7R9A7Y8_9CRUS|nr:unnamed protein product [Darwinula stevensoni]CAG0895707.1 unnamed protein product [Darwinula stevensoni]